MSVLFTAQKVVNEAGTKSGLPVHIDSNVKISYEKESRKSSYELDVCFTIGKQLFVCEAKTGSADYDRLAVVGRNLEVIPDALLLVNSDLNPDEADVISYLFPFHVCSASDTETAMRNMIQHCLTNSKQSEQIINKLPLAA